MTRILTTLALAALFTTAAMAAPAPDIPETEPAPETEVCDSADFKNQGQWVKCLTHSGVHGKELAQRIHDEHTARKGVESTPEGKRSAKSKAKRADGKARKAKAKDRMKDKARDKAQGRDKAQDKVGARR